MNSRQLVYLSVAALAIVLIASWLGFARKPDTGASAPLYPDLKANLADVKAVRVYKAGELPVVAAVRTESGWSIEQRNGYPGDAGTINSLLIALADAQLLEEKTSNPENYVALGVQDLSADATGKRIELEGVEPAINLIVGKSDTAAKGSYVRRAGEAASWLIGEQINPPADATAWLQRELLDIGADRIQETQVQIGTGARYTVAKPQRADANFDITPIPKGRELSSVSAANAFAQSLVALRLDDVQPASELADAKPAGVAQYRTFDGLTLEITGYSLDDKRWLIAQAAFDEQQARRFQMPSTPPETSASGEKQDSASSDASLQTSLDTVRSEADALNKRLSGWAFAVPQYKYDAIFKPLEELLLKK